MDEEIRKELFIQSEIPLEVRADEGEVKKIIGYASVFNQETDMFYFKEMIAPGAFTRTLKERPDVLALWDHDTAQPIGRSSAGSLTLKEDTKGLKVEIVPPDTTLGRDSLELIRTGHVKAMSFGFRVIKQEWQSRKEDELRVIKDVDLFEVSVVTFPAYEGTSAQARKLIPILSKRYLDSDEIFETVKQRKLEDYHRDLKDRIAWRARIA